MCIAPSDPLIYKRLPNAYDCKETGLKTFSLVEYTSCRSFDYLLVPQNTMDTSLSENTVLQLLLINGL